MSNDNIHAHQEVIDEGQEFEMNQYGLIDMAQTELLYKKRGTIVQPTEGVLFSNTDLNSTNTMQAMMNLNRVSFTAQNQRAQKLPHLNPMIPKVISSKFDDPHQSIKIEATNLLKKLNEGRVSSISKKPLSPINYNTTDKSIHSVVNTLIPTNANGEHRKTL